MRQPLGKRQILRLRSSETRSPNAVDLLNGQLHIERLKDLKEQDPATSNALLRTLKADMKERGGRPTDYLFPSQWKNEKPLLRGYFHKWFSETAQEAGLDVAKQHPTRYGMALGSQC